MNYKKKIKPPVKEDWIKITDENGAVYFKAKDPETMRDYMARLDKLMESLNDSFNTKWNTTAT